MVTSRRDTLPKCKVHPESNIFRNGKVRASLFVRHRSKTTLTMHGRYSGNECRYPVGSQATSLSVSWDGELPRAFSNYHPRDEPHLSILEPEPATEMSGAIPTKAVSRRISVHHSVLRKIQSSADTLPCNLHPGAFVRPGRMDDQHRSGFHISDWIPHKSRQLSPRARKPVSCSRRPSSLTSPLRDKNRTILLSHRLGFGFISVLSHRS